MRVTIGVNHAKLFTADGRELVVLHMRHEQGLFWLEVERIEGRISSAARPIAVTISRAWAIRMARSILNHYAIDLARTGDTDIQHICAQGELPRWLIPPDYVVRTAPDGRICTTSLFRFPGVSQPPPAFAAAGDIHAALSGG